MLEFAVVIYILDRLATLVSRAVSLLADAAQFAAEEYLKYSLFAMRRFLEFVADRLPTIEFLDVWYGRAPVGAIGMAAGYWLAARFVGLPTPLLLMAFLVVHGGVWGALADESHSGLERGSRDDDFPLLF